MSNQPPPSLPRVGLYGGAAMKSCPECGCRVYALGCVNCDEPKYIAEQAERIRADYHICPMCGYSEGDCRCDELSGVDDDDW